MDNTHDMYQEAREPILKIWRELKVRDTVEKSETEENDSTSSDMASMDN